MGQYYKPTLIGPRGGVRWLYSRDYDHNGMKLMEHSYLGNSFVNAVLSQILHHPMKVAWIGDYSKDDKKDWGVEPYQKLDYHQFVDIFDKVWALDRDDKKEDKLKIRPKPLSMFEDIGDFTGWYLVNHTQKIYLSMQAYGQRNKWREAYKDWRTGKTEEWDACINPLPLLTACGNNRGGGDYRSNHPDFDQVGTWAFDLIEFTAFKPEAYREVGYRFTEQDTVKEE